MLRLSIVLIIAFLLVGCSIGVYTRGIGVSVGRYDKVSLKNDPQYAQFIGTSILLKNADDYRWTLRKFSNGRYFIERTHPEFKGTEEVCSLEGKEIVISDIFKDRFNGGIYYRANVFCDGKNSFDTKKNRWYGDMLDHINIAPQN